MKSVVAVRFTHPIFSINEWCTVEIQWGPTIYRCRMKKIYRRLVLIAITRGLLEHAQGQWLLQKYANRITPRQLHVNVQPGQRREIPSDSSSSC